MIESKDIYLAMTQMNNELVNLNRELQKKNLALEKANAKIRQLIFTDNLTGLSSRKYIQESLARAISYARRSGTPICIMLGDLDHFKNVNDNYGHTIGDKVLVKVAKTMIKLKRNGDIAGRLGGEEFVLILTGADTETGQALAKRIGDKLMVTEIIPVKEKITLSWGITAIQNQDTVDSVIARADNAMYLAKNQGRNRSVII